MKEKEKVILTKEKEFKKTPTFHLLYSSFLMSSEIERIYQQLKKTSAPPIEEKKLAGVSTDRLQESIFVSPAMKKAFDGLDQETKDRLKWYGESYYSRVIDEISSKKVENASCEIAMTLKSGLSVKDLNDDERFLLRTSYGKNWPAQFGRYSETEDDPPTEQPSQ